MPERPFDKKQALVWILLTPVLAADIWCGARLTHLVKVQSGIKEDYAQANSIRNGLLSVEVWKSHLESIGTKKLSSFKFDPEKEAALKRAIEKAVTVMITEMDRTMRKPQKTFRGKMRKMAFKVLVDTPTLQAQSPRYAQAVLDEVKKPENLEKIRNLALNQIEDAKDAEEGETSSLKQVFEKYGAATLDEFNQRVEGDIRASQKEVHAYCWIMIASVLLFLLAWKVVWERPELHRPLYTLSAALAFIVLISALALPMIDIDARIQNVDFLLLGEHLQFTNQLLFYRSKSIMQMVAILMSERQAQTIVVGFLIFLFSILFPIGKLLATLVCLYGGPNLRNHKLVGFLAFYSGKWSMADVMVVAIFMAYIGFNGILNSQLKGLSVKSQAIGVIATNHTALQAGFTLFLTFTLFGLALSAILKKILPPPSGTPAV